MKTIQEKIAIMQAFADGKKIEYKPTRSIKNTTISPQPPWQGISTPQFNWGYNDYRVKEETVTNRIVVDRDGAAVAVSRNTATEVSLLSGWDMAVPDKAPHRIHSFTVDPN